MNKILIAEDEAPIANLISTALEGAGYHCTWAADGGAAADLLDTAPFDLVLLDIMLPKADGYEVLEYCKSLDTPVIFLTAKGTVQDRVKGLRLGAEDYIVKPFDTIELLARVDVVLRRYKKCDMVLEIGGVKIDTASMRVWRGEEEISLTKTEYDLLLLFARNPRRAMYRETIYERVWGGDYPFGSKAVDLHVQRLRKKVGWETMLRAVNKVGYRLEA